MLALAAGLLPSLCFWGLDAYYMRQERMYRRLHDCVRRGETAAGDLLTLDARPVAKDVPAWLGTALSPSVVALHGVVVVVLIGVLTVSWRPGRRSPRAAETPHGDGT